MEEAEGEGGEQRQEEEWWERKMEGWERRREAQERGPAMRPFEERRQGRNLDRGNPGRAKPTASPKVQQRAWTVAPAE
jgi:hypothetical protein